MSVQLGWIDTNVFIHALSPGHREYARSRAIILALDEGRAEGWIDPVTVHELSYTLLKRPGFTRAQVGEYVRGVMLCQGLHAEDKSGLIAALIAWEDKGIGFNDAWLAVLSRRSSLPVCSANAREVQAVPNTFADAAL